MVPGLIFGGYSQSDEQELQRFMPLRVYFSQLVVGIYALWLREFT